MALTRASAAVIKTEEIVNNRNRIINGDMRIDQRNAGASVNSTSGGGVYPVDRFEQETAIGGGVMAMQQSTTAPTGFSYSLKLTVGTADTSLAAGDKYNLRQIIEGYNVADLGFGTASAKTVTISFWVQSALTGTYCVGLRNGTNARSYVANYTINSANTWEYKTVTIAGDTTGTWGTTNGRGITLSFALASGSTAQTTVNTWSAGEFLTTSSQVNWMDTVGNTFYLTGVQLEVGSVATPFERRPFGTELSLCQRYCFVVRGDLDQATGFVGYSETTSAARFGVRFPTSMRSSPSFALSGTCRCQGGTTDSADFTSGLVITGTAGGSYDGSALRVTGTSNLGAADRGFNLQTRANGTTLTFSAEL